MDANEKMLEISSGQVYYWTYHPDKKPVVVMIHGFTGSHEGFQYIIPHLKNYQIIVPDLPGFGVSDLPERDDWSVDAIARLANEFVEKLALDKPPIILGHSMGGLTVSSMIYQQPELYDKQVILLSPVPTAIRRNDKRRPGAILGALQYRLGHRTGRFGDKLVKSRTISRALTSFIMETTDAQLRREIYGHHFKNLDYISDIEFYSVVYSDINRIGSIDYADALRNKRVLLMAGDKDTVTPLTEMKKFAASAKPEIFTVISGTGHLIHYEKGPEVATAVRDFIANK